MTIITFKYISNEIVNADHAKDDDDEHDLHHHDRYYV